ncbi:hypothetical protein P4O66_004099 [Electrophorus voltai]|uniref:Protein kinase domain-containing protein n=1 Tax=Electrophorus voltai TaxID=2609070 RepID=A0AAD8ZS80_9TELE|nr:hypothetical protein P4O66_004099 [Electrophorus voltai]
MSHQAKTVEICKGQSADSKQAHLYGLSVQQSVPLHFNLQQDCGHFIACVPQSMLPGEEAPAPPAGPPAEPSPSAPPEQERVVVIAREVPCQTAADFVKEWASFHRAQPEVYERRVCFLLLQLCNGLEHLKAHGVTHRDLCLENLLLVPHRRPAAATDPQQRPPAPPAHQQLLQSQAAERRRLPPPAATPPACGGTTPAWRPRSSRLRSPRKFDEFQTGILIYEVLHHPQPVRGEPRAAGAGLPPGRAAPPSPPSPSTPPGCSASPACCSSRTP